MNQIQHVKTANNGAGFNLLPRQELAVQKIVLQKKKASLLFHSVGSGKTITSISAAINLLNWNHAKDKRVIQVVTPTAIFEPGFLSDIQTKIPNIIYSGINPDNKIGKYKQDIGQVHEFTYLGKYRPCLHSKNNKDPIEPNGFYIHAVEYRDFSKLYMKFNEKQDVIKNNFDHKVVIFDEAHRLFRQFDMCDSKSMLIDKYIYNMLLNGSQHVIFMSGTPMKEDLVSMFKLYNLINLLNNPDSESKFNIDKMENYNKYIKFSAKQDIGFNLVDGFGRYFKDWIETFSAIKDARYPFLYENDGEYIKVNWFSDILNIHQSSALEKTQNKILYNERSPLWSATFSNFMVYLNSPLYRNKQEGGSDEEFLEHKCQIISSFYHAENVYMKEDELKKITNIYKYYLMSIKNKIKNRDAPNNEQAGGSDELNEAEMNEFQKKIINTTKRGVYKLQKHQINYQSDMLKNSVFPSKTIDSWDDLWKQYTNDKVYLLNADIDMVAVNTSFVYTPLGQDNMNLVLEYIKVNRYDYVSQKFKNLEPEIVNNMRSYESILLAMNFDDIKQLIDSGITDVEDEPLEEETFNSYEIDYNKVIKNEEKVNNAYEIIKDVVKEKVVQPVVDEVNAVVDNVNAVVHPVVDLKNDIKEVGIFSSVITRIASTYVNLTTSINPITGEIYGGDKYSNDVIYECTDDFKRFLFSTKTKRQQNITNISNLLSSETIKEINNFYDTFAVNEKERKRATMTKATASRGLGGSKTTRKHGGKIKNKHGTKKNGGGGGQLMKRRTNNISNQTQVVTLGNTDRKPNIKETFLDPSNRAQERNRASTKQNVLLNYYERKFEEVNKELKELFIKKISSFYLLKEEAEIKLKRIQRNIVENQENNTLHAKIELYKEVIVFYTTLINVSKTEDKYLFEKTSELGVLISKTLSEQKKGQNQQVGGFIPAIITNSIIPYTSYITKTLLDNYAGTMVSGVIQSYMPQMPELFSGGILTNLSNMITNNITTLMLSPVICKTIFSLLSAIVYKFPTIQLLLDTTLHGALVLIYGVGSFGNIIPNKILRPIGKENAFNSVTITRDNEYRKFMKGVTILMSGVSIMRNTNVWDQLAKAKERGNRTKKVFYMNSILRNAPDAFNRYYLDKIIHDSKDFISSVNPDMKSINSSIFDLLKHTNISLFKAVNEDTDIKLIKDMNDDNLSYPKISVNVILNTYTPEQSFLYNALNKKDINVIMPLRVEYLPCVFNQNITADKRYVSNYFDGISDITDSKLITRGVPIVKYDPSNNSYIDNRKNNFQHEIKSEKFDKLLKRLLLMKTGYMVDEDNGFLVTQPHIIGKKITPHGTSDGTSDTIKFDEAGKCLNNENNSEGPNCSMQQINKNNDKDYYNFLPFVFSSSDEVGLNFFAKYLDNKGFNYLIMHDESKDAIKASLDAIQTNYKITKIEESDAYDFYLKHIKQDAGYIEKKFITETNKANAITGAMSSPFTNEEWVKTLQKGDDPICILLHPFKTEGIDGKYNPAIFFLDNPRNYGDYNQLCGRVLRTYGQPNSTNFKNYSDEEVRKFINANKLKKHFYLNKSNEKKTFEDYAKQLKSNKENNIQTINKTLQDNLSAVPLQLAGIDAAREVDRLKKEAENDIAEIYKTTILIDDYNDISANYADMVETRKRAYPIITSTEYVLHKLAIDNVKRFFTKNKSIMGNDKVTEYADREFEEIEDFFVPVKVTSTQITGPEKESNTLDYKDQLYTFMMSDIFNRSFNNINNLKEYTTKAKCCDPINIYNNSNETNINMISNFFSSIVSYYARMGKTEYKKKYENMGNIIYNKSRVEGLINRYSEAVITTHALFSSQEDKIKNWTPNEIGRNIFIDEKEKAVSVNTLYSETLVNTYYMKNIIKILNSKEEDFKVFDIANNMPKTRSDLTFDNIKRYASSEDIYKFDEPLLEECSKIIDMYDPEYISLKEQNIELLDYGNLKKNGYDYTTLTKEYVKDEDNGKIQDLTDIGEIFKDNTINAEQPKILRPWNDVFSNSLHGSKKDVIHINRSTEYSDYSVSEYCDYSVDYYQQDNILNTIKKYNETILNDIRNNNDDYKDINSIINYFKYIMDQKNENNSEFDISYGNDISFDVDISFDIIDNYVGNATIKILNKIRGNNLIDHVLNDDLEEKISTSDREWLSNIDQDSKNEIISKSYNLRSQLFQKKFPELENSPPVKTLLCISLCKLVFLYKVLYNKQSKQQDKIMNDAKTKDAQIEKDPPVTRSNNVGGKITKKRKMQGGNDTIRKTRKNKTMH